MAAPPEITLTTLKGSFILNKTYSTDIDGALALQGIGWLFRKAIGLATITLHITQYKDDKGADHIDISQTATGGIKGTSELRTIDGVPRPHEDHVFGALVGRSQWIKKSEVGANADPTHLGEEDRKFLVEGWGEEFSSPDVQVMENYVVSEKGKWVAWAVWGFDVIGEGADSKRRYARHIVVKSTKSGEAKHLTLVYDLVKSE